mmetsp:Transcript_11767/g.35295  ORF Transcript_11767/g.35295 Transcript_11767/m.35295 type:complete len:231 (+) Transcript_11767:269-961(+)
MEFMLQALPLPRGEGNNPKEESVERPRAAERPERPRAERKPGKRRTRRAAQLEYLLSVARDAEDEEEEVSYPNASDDAARLIENDELLRKWLNGSQGRKHFPKKSPSVRGPPRLCEARRGWLRVERKLRPWVRRLYLSEDRVVYDVEALVSRWIDAEDDQRVLEFPGVASRAPILRVPTCVVDAHVVHAIAQFHGCRVLPASLPDFVVLRRPQPHHRLNHNASIRDVLSS